MRACQQKRFMKMQLSNYRVLTYLFHHLIHNVFSARRYFDFGTSNEDAGRILNSGLLHQKTGLGGRGAAYQIFRLKP